MLSLIASADINTAMKDKKKEDITEYSKPRIPIKGKKLSINEKTRTKIAHTKYFFERNIEKSLY